REPRADGSHPTPLAIPLPYLPQQRTPRPVRGTRGPAVRAPHVHIPYAYAARGSYARVPEGIQVLQVRIRQSCCDLQGGRQVRRVSQADRRTQERRRLGAERIDAIHGPPREEHDLRRVVPGELDRWVNQETLGLVGRSAPRNVSATQC